MLSFVVASLLTLYDPAGDAVGNGTLTAPTASAFRSTDPFDLIRITVPDAPTFGVQLEYALIPAEDAFPQAITELYVHDGDAAARGEPGRAALLPGSGMRLPEGRGWHLAVRVVGERVWVFSPEGGPDEADFPTEVTEAVNARVEREGNLLTLTTDVPVPGRFSLYGMTGVYDPFSETGWRAVRTQPSPWSFASTDQRVNVLDVLTDTYAQQQAAINQGVLPEIRASTFQAGWLLVAGAGVVIALCGFVARLLIRPAAEAAAPPDAPQPDTAPTGAGGPARVRPRVIVVRRPDPPPLTASAEAEEDTEQDHLEPQAV
jgi:hypothetical protein